MHQGAPIGSGQLTIESNRIEKNFTCIHIVSHHGLFGGVLVKSNLIDRQRKRGVGIVVESPVAGQKIDSNILCQYGDGGTNNLVITSGNLTTRNLCSATSDGAKAACSTTEPCQ
jgi:hypothetical protein